MDLQSSRSRSVSIGQIAAVFSRIGIGSFGGGLVGWMRRETVERRKWVEDREFLSGLALSQILPGANMTNLALYLGMLMRGGLGAGTALIGMLLLPSIVIIVLFEFYAHARGASALHFILDGVAAAAIGLNIAAGISAIRRSWNIATVVIAAAVFIAVGVLHWSMALVVLGLAPISIGLAWMRRHG